MKNSIHVITVTVLLMTHCAKQTSFCDSNTDPSENHVEITSTNDYLELNHKFIDNAHEDVQYWDRARVEQDDGFVYHLYSNFTLFVTQKNSTKPTQIDGFYSFILPDANNNLIYLGTYNGLVLSECGGKKLNKIKCTDGIDAFFGVVDNAGNVYFGNVGRDGSEENLYLLRKEDQLLILISGIEPRSSSSPTDKDDNHNKIAVDTKGNIYVGAFPRYIYVIEPGQATARKLKDIKSSKSVTSIVVDSKDNVYFRTNTALHILKSGENKLTKIFDGAGVYDYDLWLDKNDNLHFEVDGERFALGTEVATDVIEIKTIVDSNGFTATNFTHLLNLQVKNKILYFTSALPNSDDQKLIFALRLNETSLRMMYKTDVNIASLAIDNSNNIYFFKLSGGGRHFAPFVLRPNSDIPIAIPGVVSYLSKLCPLFSDNHNNIFFGAHNGLYVLQDDESTPVRVGGTENFITHLVVDRNDNVYFSTGYEGVFFLKFGELEAVLIEGINTDDGLYVEVYADKKVDVIYFKTMGALYKLNGGEVALKTVRSGRKTTEYFLSNCMNETLYVGKNFPKQNVAIFSVNSEDKNATFLTEVDDEIFSLDSDSFNNLFFMTGSNQLHMLRPQSLESTVIAENVAYESLRVDRDNNVYFMSVKGEAYVLHSGETEATKIKSISGDLKYFLENDDNIFVVTAKNDEYKLFLIRKKLPFESTFTNRDLGQIDNNDDETIFNILSYLNREDNYLLSKSKNKISNKTLTSATVTATNGKFRGSFNVVYTLKSENDESVQNFKFLELLKRSVFFDQVAKNSYNFQNKKIIRDIVISTEFLNFFSVEVSAKSEAKQSYEFKDICFNKKQISNPSLLPQTVKVEECTYETKETISFYITRGLNKTDDIYKDSVLNSEDENILLDSFNVNANNQAKITLSDAFDLSNLNQHIREIVLHNFRENEQEILVPPKQRTVVKYSARTFVLETELNLKQRIKGSIVAKIIYTDESDESIQITIKQAMQMLGKFNLMPSEINVNQDRSITFNGRGKLIVKRESDPKIIRNFYNL